MLRQAPHNPFTSQRAIDHAMDDPNLDLIQKRLETEPPELVLKCGLGNDRHTGACE